MPATKTLQTADFQAIPLDICVQRGDSPIIPVSLSSGGSPLDTSLGTFTLTVSDTEEPTDATGQQFQVTGVAVGDGSTGQLTFTPTQANNDLDPNLEWFHDIDVLGHPTVGDRTIFKGKYIVAQDINKATV